MCHWSNNLSTREGDSRINSPIIALRREAKIHQQTLVNVHLARGAWYPHGNVPDTIGPCVTVEAVLPRMHDLV